MSDTQLKEDRYRRAGKKCCKSFRQGKACKDCPLHAALQLDGVHVKRSEVDRVLKRGAEAKNYMVSLS